MSNCNYRCAKATGKDIKAIAKYLHLTDPYIYPIICSDPENEEWQEFIFECALDPKNIYSLNHLVVALHEERVIGAACIIPCGTPLHFLEGIILPESLQNGMKIAVEGYFKPLMEESVLFEGYNIVNVCIDEAYRGKGIGELLVKHCVKEYGSATIHLDVIASNTAAVKVYERCGFCIKNEYMGFSGDDSDLLCYHMVREKD